MLDLGGGGIKLYDMTPFSWLLHLGDEKGYWKNTHTYMFLPRSSINQLLHNSLSADAPILILSTPVSPLGLRGFDVSHSHRAFSVV